MSAPAGIIGANGVGCGEVLICGNVDIHYSVASARLQRGFTCVDNITYCNDLRFGSFNFSFPGKNPGKNPNCVSRKTQVGLTCRFTLNLALSLDSEGLVFKKSKSHDIAFDTIKYHLTASMPSRLAAWLRPLAVVYILFQ